MYTFSLYVQSFELPTLEQYWRNPLDSLVVECSLWVREVLGSTPARGRVITQTLKSLQVVLFKEHFKPRFSKTGRLWVSFIHCLIRHSMLILEMYKLWLVQVFGAFRVKMYSLYQLHVCHSTSQRVYSLCHMCFCSSGSQHNLLTKNLPRIHCDCLVDREL